MYVLYMPAKGETPPSSSMVIFKLLSTIQKTGKRPSLPSSDGVHARFNPKSNCYFVYLTNYKDLITAMNTTTVLCAKPYLKVVTSLCITQDPALTRLYFTIAGDIRHQMTDIFEWFKKGKVQVINIGPVFDKASNKRHNRFYVLIRASHASITISWGMVGTTRFFKGNDITLVKAVDSRQLLRLKQQNAQRR